MGEKEVDGRLRPSHRDSSGMIGTAGAIEQMLAPFGDGPGFVAEGKGLAGAEAGEAFIGEELLVHTNAALGAAGGDPEAVVEGGDGCVQGLGASVIQLPCAEIGVGSCEQGVLHEDVGFGNSITPLQQQCLTAGVAEVAGPVFVFAKQPNIFEPFRGNGRVLAIVKFKRASGVLSKFVARLQDTSDAQRLRRHVRLQQRVIKPGNRFAAEIGVTDVITSSLQHAVEPADVISVVQIGLQCAEDHVVDGLFEQGAAEGLCAAHAEGIAGNQVYAAGWLVA